jgi:hypothetical protein
MTKPSRWTVEAVFASVVGATMAVFLAGACLVGQRASVAGSELVPVTVLQKLVDTGRFCQTLTEDEVLYQMPRRHC